MKFMSWLLSAGFISRRTKIDVNGYELNDNCFVILLCVARKLKVGYLQVNALSK